LNEEVEKAVTYAEVNDIVLSTIKPPGRRWFLTVTLLFILVVLFVSSWIYQVASGMWVAGISHPVSWGVYIGNFIFWVGIAHSGTLISAILYLLRADWRKAVARSAEAMTVFAVMTAGLFPLIHLGRLWVIAYILPYPSERQLWPNFTSPLVMDVVAVTTYLTVSSMFWYVGLIPDLAAARDHFAEKSGPGAFSTRIFAFFSLGWSGSSVNWHAYDRSYLFFAALATPLVISVHSVVSWDFAVSTLPGWHTTLFAPYFVAGAIHSGLAMVLTLIIPMRRILKLERVITQDHLQLVAMTIIVTAMIVGYAYVVEPWAAWYSGDRWETLFAAWRFTGHLAWIYYLLPVLNVLIPMLYFFSKVRLNLTATFIISVLINVGMWLERYFIVTASLSHDFMPHNWGRYQPTIIEIIITIGSFSWFFLLFLLFARFLPTVAQNEIKEELAEEHGPILSELHKHRQVTVQPAQGPFVVGVFSVAGQMVTTLQTLVDNGFKSLEVFTPMKVPEVMAVLGKRPSPVRYFTLCGAVLGCIGAFALPIFSASVNNLIVGGKHPASLIPYCVIGFEGTVLLGSLANLVGLLIYARLYPGKERSPCHENRFGRDKMAIIVAAGAERSRAEELFKTHGAEEVYVK
jgi:molybdopterin-containing oxidoreductase family membrane subunit